MKSNTFLKGQCIVSKTKSKARFVAARISLSYRKRRAIKRMEYVAFLAKTLSDRKHQLAHDDAFYAAIEESANRLAECQKIVHQGFKEAPAI